MTLSIIIIFVLTGASMMVWGLGSILVRGFSSRKMGLMLLLGGLIIVVNTSLYVRDAYWEEDASTGAVFQGQESTNPTALMRQPESICRLLVDQGFAPEIQSESGEIWGQVTPMYYSCEAEKSMLDAETPMQLTYRVQSDDGERVDLVRLQVEILKDGSEAAALEEFRRLAGRLFERLPMPMPAGFHAAIDNRIFRQFDEENGTVELLRDRYEQGYRLRMEIRPDSRRP